MSVIKNFLKIVDIQTFVVTLLALAATYVCIRFNWHADLPSGLIGIAIIFPIVFSINTAYKRREEVLNYFASLKAHAVALYYANRDWVKDGGEMQDESRDMTKNLLTKIKEYFSANPDQEKERFGTVYQAFSEFSHCHERMRDKNVAANEVSRCNQYLSKMIVEFEKMRNILQYRTPVSLRAYSQIFLNIFPIIYAPYFAHLSKESAEPVGYVVAFLYSIVLVSLDNIQEDLESPYDAVGADDVDLDVVEAYIGVLKK